MLKRIICDKFKQKEISFHLGLNAVVGDDIASNSIGKSTLLMIIDFVFGGEKYIKSNGDAIEQLGHHEFFFEFEFENEKLYFSRSTNEYLKVKICDSAFNVQEIIKIEEYNKILQNKYHSNIDELGFRDIVGRYFRIYGKENLNEHKPIQYFEKESSKKSILALVKLFNKYNYLKEYENQIAEFDEEKKILTNAAKKNLIPNVGKSVFNQNVKMINELSQHLDNIQKELTLGSNNIDELVSEEIMQLRREKSTLSIQRNNLLSRLKRIQFNMKNKGANIDLELDQFKLYFPGFNIEQAKKVDCFHNKLTKILKYELKSASEDLQAQISDLNLRINKIDEEITNKANINNDGQKFLFDKLLELSEKRKQLIDENQYFIKTKNISDNLRAAKSNLVEIKERTIGDICNQINTRMYELNKEIYGNSRRAPILHIHKNQYSFSTYGDTGTGTAFANLITFDLALLDLTCLPALVHDLPLLKNIENNAMEKIIFLYAKSKKQIFIAIDKLNSYDFKASEIIKSHSIIQLSKDKTLFIKNWKNTRIN